MKKTNYEIWKSIRKGWGDTKPYQRIEKNKKAYDRKKFKKDWE